MNARFGIKYLLSSSLFLLLFSAVFFILYKTNAGIFGYFVWFGIFYSYLIREHIRAFFLFLLRELRQIFFIFVAIILIESFFEDKIRTALHYFSLDEHELFVSVVAVFLGAVAGLFFELVLKGMISLFTNVRPVPAKTTFTYNNEVFLVDPPYLGLFFLVYIFVFIEGCVATGILLLFIEETIDLQTILVYGGLLTILVAHLGNNFPAIEIPEPNKEIGKVEIKGLSVMLPMALGVIVATIIYVPIVFLMVWLFLLIDTLIV